MADFTYYREHKIRHIWKIPGAAFGGHGTAIVEVEKAIANARNKYINLHGKGSSYDDWLRAYAADDDIILFFDEEPSRGDTGD